MPSMSILKLGLAAAVPTLALAASGAGHTTRYWDCCKPSCGWSGKASVSQPVNTCNAQDSVISANTQSGCDGGSAFTCTDNSPWAVNDNLAYGFSATALNGGTESSWCCACYALTFTSGPVAGKTMVVQSTNTGGDISDNQFDMLMPGGGEGLFDGCTPEYGSFPGAQYGGVSSVSDCASMPAKLQAGCEWRFNWFMNADNPNVNFEQVQCPSELTAITGCKRDDDSSFPVFTPPSGSNTGSGKPTTSSKASSSPTKPPSTGGGGGSAALYGQCGGQGWSGATSCASGSTCKVSNPYYSQCLPS